MKRILIVLTILLAITGCSVKDQVITVGFIYTGSINSEDIELAQDNARKQVVEDFSGQLKTIVKENVSNETLPGVVDEMIKNGASLFFISDNKLDGALAPITEQHPDIDFVVYDSGITGDNIKSYSFRKYEANYLAGIAAAESTSGNLIGYISKNQDNQSLVEINAFALGVRDANPNVKIQLDYLENDTRTSINAAISKLIFNGCDVISTNLDDNTPLVEASDRGVKVIGNSDHNLTDRDTYLGSLTLDFRDFYYDIIENKINGQFDNSVFVGTLQNGFVDLTTNNQILRQSAENSVAKAKEEINNGNLAVFTGPIIDTNGNQLFAVGQVLSEADLKNMNYLLSNIQVVD